MNTEIHAWLYCQDKTAVTQVQTLFDEYERRLSRFDADSELSRLNRCRDDRFRASPVLFEAVQVALWAAGATGGIYDPTILASLERAGYDRSFEKIKIAAPYLNWQQAETQNRAARCPLRRHSYRDITLDISRREILKPRGLSIDLGGMGKGWTVDRVADRLQGEGPFLVNAGGDLFAYGSPDGQRGWAIDLTHPMQVQRSLAGLRLKDRALATSTVVKRRWRKNGRLMHHLIDPRTDLPACTDALSVSVVAQRTVLGINSITCG